MVKMKQNSNMISRKLVYQKDSKVKVLVYSKGDMGKALEIQIHDMGKERVILKDSLRSLRQKVIKLLECLSS